MWRNMLWPRALPFYLGVLCTVLASVAWYAVSPQPAPELRMARAYFTLIELNRVPGNAENLRDIVVNYGDTRTDILRDLGITLDDVHRYVCQSQIERAERHISDARTALKCGLGYAPQSIAAATELIQALRNEGQKGEADRLSAEVHSLQRITRDPGGCPSVPAKT